MNMYEPIDFSGELDDRYYPHTGSLIMESDNETIGIVTKWDKANKRVHIAWCKPVWGQKVSVESESNVTWSHRRERLIIHINPF